METTIKSKPKEDDWEMVVDINGDDQIFEGNSDADSIHTNVFITPITVRQIKLWPLENGHATDEYKLYKSMRVEVYGCNKDDSELPDANQVNLQRTINRDLKKNYKFHQFQGFIE